MADEYVAGVCNIGKEEIRQRLLVSFASLAIALVGVVGLVAVDAPRSARWIVLIPFLGWAFGLVQARHRFCLAYGMRGAFNFGRLGNISQVVDPEFRRQDLKTVRKIVAMSLAYALAATLGFVLLPL